MPIANPSKIAWIPTASYNKYGVIELALLVYFLFYFSLNPTLLAIFIYEETAYRRFSS